MQPHQERVVEERHDLADKITKLGAFIGGGVFSQLDAAEQGRLREQHDTMVKYRDILDKRIQAFAGIA